MIFVTIVLWDIIPLGSINCELFQQGNERIILELGKMQTRKIKGKQSYQIWWYTVVFFS